MDIRVGDVKAGQVVSGIAEEVEQGIAGRRYYFWDCLVPPGRRYY